MGMLLQLLFTLQMKSSRELANATNPFISHHPHAITTVQTMLTCCLIAQIRYLTKSCPVITCSPCNLLSPGPAQEPSGVKTMVISRPLVVPCGSQNNRNNSTDTQDPDPEDF